eukprot:Skav224393  [mRNA]  locus=scaffold2452:90473:91398:- [translate_table: standard]
MFSDEGDYKEFGMLLALLWLLFAGAAKLMLQWQGPEERSLHHGDGLVTSEVIADPRWISGDDGDASDLTVW